MNRLYKFAMTCLLATFLSACGTAGGLVTGMGEDLTKAGNWIKAKGE